MAHVEFWMESKFKRDCMKETMFLVDDDMTEEEINAKIEERKELLLKSDNKIHVYNIRTHTVIFYTITGYTSEETRKLVGRK